MSLILGRGVDAKKAIEQNTELNHAEAKAAFIRLKPGESFKVRILSAHDFVAYKAHAHFNKGIHTQPCIAPSGEKCLLCEAANYRGDVDKEGNNAWSSLWARKRLLFAFIDLVSDSLCVFDATRNQAEALISTIEEYADDLADIAFTFKRFGEKNETIYSLSPVLKPDAELTAVFKRWDGREISLETFERILQPRTIMQQTEDLERAGFPLSQL